MMQLQPIDPGWLAPVGIGPRPKAADSLPPDAEPELIALAAGLVTLTARQMTIVRLGVRGMGTIEIGRELGIASQTVKNHYTHIYRRLGFRPGRSPGRRLAYLLGAFDAITRARQFWGQAIADELAAALEPDDGRRDRCARARDVVHTKRCIP